jgi:hypothetical protein
MGKDLEGSGRSLIEIPSRDLPGGTEGNYVTISVKISRLSAKIRSEDLPNTSQELYRYIASFVINRSNFNGLHGSCSKKFNVCLKRVSTRTWRSLQGVFKPSFTLIREAQKAPFWPRVR